MTEDRKFSQTDIDQAVYEALANRAKVEFEENTRNVLRQINRRLDEANNYKATIGADVKELKRKMDDRETRDEEDRRILAERDEKDEQAKEDRYRWYQDKWIRFGIVCGALWELFSVLQSLGVVKHISIGFGG